MRLPNPFWKIVPPNTEGAIAFQAGGGEDTEGRWAKLLRNSAVAEAHGLRMTHDARWVAICGAHDGDVAANPDVVTVLVLDAVDLPFHYDRYVADHLAGLLEGRGPAPDRIFLVYPHAAVWEVWVVKRNDIQWPDERLPMPHTGYQDPPKLVPEHAWPRQFVEQFKRGVGRETPAKWRPLVLAEAEVQDAKRGAAHNPAG